MRQLGSVVTFESEKLLMGSRVGTRLEAEEPLGAGTSPRVPLEQFILVDFLCLSLIPGPGRSEGTTSAICACHMFLPLWSEPWLPCHSGLRIFESTNQNQSFFRSAASVGFCGRQQGKRSHHRVGDYGTVMWNSTAVEGFPILPSCDSKKTSELQFESKSLL